MKIACLGISIILCSTYSLAQQGKPLEQLNKETQYKKAIAAADNALLALKALTAERALQCEKAVGNRNFCECLAENVPFDFDFNQYVAIMTRTKQENGYSSLNIKQKTSYDIVPKVRDTCVTKK